MVKSRVYLLEHVKNKMPKNLLSDHYLIACQHLLPSTYVMLQYMLALGLKKENCAFIGKCYSSSSETIKKLKNSGIYVCPSSHKLNPGESFDVQLKQNIEKFLAHQITRMGLSSNSKIIILDDGGELIVAADKLMKEYEDLFAVEQTSSGYNKLCSSSDHSFPIINVARSVAKLNYESPMIARSVTKKFMERVRSFDFEIKKCLIVGMGAIGQSIFNEICQKYSTDTYDKKFYENTYSDLDKYDLIIGTTGQTILSAENYHLLKNKVVLISASSSDREFETVFLRHKMNKKINIHDNIMVDGICLLNNGFPVNFCGNGLDTVPPEEIQFTTSLLFAGVCQGVVQNNPNGFVDLNEELQISIINLYLNNRNELIYANNNYLPIDNNETIDKCLENQI